MKKTRLVYILHGLASGGTEAFVMNVVKQLDKERYDITFILAVDDDGKNFQFREREALELGIRIYRTNDLNNIQKKVAHYKKLKQLLQETGPYDVVHSNMSLFNGVNLVAAKKAGVKIRISHSHNPHSQFAVSRLKKIVAGIYRFVMRYFIEQNATLMLGCSDWANVFLYGKKWRKKEKCHVLPNGIDLGKYQNCQVAPDIYRGTLGIPKDKVYVLTVGRLNIEKNPAFILAVIEELHKLCEDIFLTWVGEGMLQKEIEDTIRQSDMGDYVKLLGVRKDVEEVMNCNQVFLFPSLFEGFGLSIVEAQAVGLMCFCSTAVPLDVDCGLCKYLSLDQEPKEWAQVIWESINGSKKEWHLSQDKLNRYSIQRTVKKLEEYYA